MVKEPVTPHNFIQNFQVGDQQVSVEFVTMSIREKRLYQLWLPFEGKKVRIHMQLNNKGKFEIVKREICPPVFLTLEESFAQAILDS